MRARRKERGAKPGLAATSLPAGPRCHQSRPTANARVNPTDTRGTKRAGPVCTSRPRRCRVGGARPAQRPLRTGRDKSGSTSAGKRVEQF